MSEFEDLVLEYEDGFPGSGPNWAAYKKMIERGKYLEAENARLREAARMIPVEERLPENPGWYMVRVSDPAGKVNHIEPKWYHGRGKWDVYTWTVTHWQQKPEPFEVK